MLKLKEKYICLLVVVSNLLSSCNNTTKFNSNEDKSVSDYEQVSTNTENEDFENDITNTPTESTKPSLKSIPYDLIGHIITEGTANGYYPQNWRYIIEDSDILDLNIEEILSDDDNQFTAILRLKLRGVSDNSESDFSNYYFDSKVKIRYINHSQNGWIIDYVNSLGLNVVSDGAYDDLIQENHDQSKSLNNNGDIPLTVGGKYLKDNVWHKFLIHIPAHGFSAPLYDGVAFARYVDDSVIDFIIR